MFFSELLCAALLFIYGLFMAITYKIANHYFNKYEILKDLAFWIFHIVLFILFYDAITNHDFRLYQLLLLSLGFYIGMRFLNLDTRFITIDYILVFIKKIFQKIKANLFLSDTIKALLYKLKSLCKKLKITTKKNKQKN